MPISVPNINLLAPFVAEIWRGSQNKNWELLISPDAPLGDKLHMPTSIPNFNFLALIVS